MPTTPADTSNEPLDNAQTASPTTGGDAVVAERSAKIPAFSFPFSAAAFAPNKSDEQPWHQKNNQSNHDKRPGRAPNGTRRSMGKR